MQAFRLTQFGTTEPVCIVMTGVSCHRVPMIGKVTMGALHDAGIGAIRHEIQPLDLDRVWAGAWEHRTMVTICLCS